MAQRVSLQMKSMITGGGELRVWLDEARVPNPGDDEVIVRIDAAPVNPADLLVLFGPADLSTLRAAGDGRRGITADVPAVRLPALTTRLDVALPLGNEGAGVVVDAGRAAKHLIGRTVALRDAM